MKIYTIKHKTLGYLCETFFKNYTNPKQDTVVKHWKKVKQTDKSVIKFGFIGVNVELTKLDKLYKLPVQEEILK